MNVGSAIKSIRKDKKITQVVMSEITGLSQTYLSQLENGIYSPTGKTLEIICKCLDVHEIELYISATDFSKIPKAALKRISASLLSKKINAS